MSNKEQADNVAKAQLEAQFGETLQSTDEIVKSKRRKEYTFYVAVGIAVLVECIAALFGAEAITLLPALLGVAFVGFWAFDVK